MDVIISNPAEFAQKKAKLKNGGAKNLHVVSDYDRTITKAYVNGVRYASILHLVRQGKYLTPDYSPRAFALADEYIPIELNHSLPFDFRREKLVEWWQKHIALMVECGMNKQEVERICREIPFNPREGFFELVKTLDSKKIPILIFSSSVTDLIEGLLRREKMLFPNVHILSNKYVYDAQGNVTGYADGIIHSLNKNEIAVKETPYFNEIAHRKNVIVMGDVPGDAVMADGLTHEIVLKIGFLNEHVEKNLEAYKKVFDVLILNDGSFEFVNELLKETLE